MATEYFNDAWRIPNNKNQSLVSNYSMKFNGTSDFVDCGNDSSLQITGAMTVSCWFKGQGGSGTVGGVGKLGNNGSRGFCLGVDSSSTITFFIAPTASSLVSASYSHTTDTNWHHLVGVFTPSTSLELYFDGQLVDTTSTSASSQYNASNNLQIGARGDSTGFFNGEIDQVCIFDYALPATGTNSVATLYGGGTAVTNPMSLSPKPVAYYQLGDQSVSTGPTSDYLVPNNSLQDYVFDFIPNDFIDCGDNDIFSFTNGTGTDLPFSLSAWVYMHDATGFRVITKYTTDNAPPIEWYLYTTGSGILRLRLYDVAASANIGRGYSVAMTNFENQWINIVGTYNANELNSGLKIYINGSRVDDQDAGTGSGYQGMSNTDNPVRIGRMGTGYANGEFSNVSIFNTELSLEQVEAIYNNGTPNDISSLSPIAWWKLNAADTFDGTDWTIKDYAGSNDGTSSGMTSANLVQSNLQHTSGFSPYALSLDGANDYLKLNNTLNNSILFGQTSFTISAWIYLSSINTPSNNPVISNLGNVAARQSYMLRVSSLKSIVVSVVTTTGTFQLVSGNGSFEFDKWEHITITLENQELKCYLNGRQVGSTITNVSGSVVNSVGEGHIGARGTGVTSQVFGGNLSNIAVWQGSAQNSVTLYNNGVPGDLTSLNPSAWWQLGSNSSFDTNWTCLNEGSLTGLNAVSVNMTEDDIVNGVGYSANGLGTSSIEIVGDAPYSTANGISENMDVLDRTTDVPS